ncbi:hypothetical protein, partial [Anaerovibrio lipolyticus]|uniref:hypothetical protein n=1 Tax=Anaerovibrio lipolyticus TaxID=82374 RepID=UPI0023F22513
ININAIKTGNFTANSTGIAAGLASAGWNSTYVKDSSTSQINIKGKNYLFEADALSFQTANAPKLKTDIDNHAAAVVTGMASKATVEANSSALINVADDNFFSAGSVFFGAQVGKKDEITAASKLRSVAVAGMAVPGYSGDESNITTKTNAAINIGKEDYSYTINNNNNNANNNTENNSENEDNTRYATLTIDATNMTSRQNDISNVTVSGLKFAAGGIKGTTRAEDMVSTTAGGGDVNKLVMGATGNSYTDSYVRGSGGGLMDYGTNAKAITYFDNSATANIYGKWFAQDNVYVNAKQFDSMDTQTFSASGGVLQGSGVYTSLNIGDKGRITSANIANGADITANKVYVGAENNINTNKNNKYSSRLDITAGNALGMSVLESKDVIKKGTQVNIGNNVKVTTVGTQEYEALNKDALKNYATGLNAGIAESIVVQSRTDYTSANKVTLGTGATLTSNGSYDVAGVTLAASDDINSTVHAEGKVAGVAGAGPTAITEHKINRSNAVEVKGTIKSNKDINLYAGADNNGSKSNVKQLTIADAHNDTAIPLGWRRDLIVENRRNNSVQVESGALGEALRNINIKAANGTENILKQASYHTIYGGEGGDGKKAIPVVKTASDGNVNVDRFVNESTNYAKVDGSLLAGFQDKINVTITGQVVPKDLLGHNDIADVNDATKIVETHDVTAKGNNPSYTISIVDDEGRHYTELEKAAKQYTGSYANVLAERWNELNKLISAYNGEDGKGGDGQTAIAYAGYMAEMQLLEAKLNSLGLMEEKVVDGKTVKVPVTEGYDIPIVALPGLMEASGGTINVDANNFYGKGSVVAKTNPEVKVENKSNAYLVVNDITIKDKGQGVIYRDNIIKSDADGKNQIKQLNSDKKYDVSYSKLKSGTEGNSGVNILSENPSLSGITLTDKVTKDGKITYVNSVFNGMGAIEIAGHVNAGTTDVTITNKNKTGGDIIINGSGTKATGIDGHSIRLTAQYGSVNQSYTKGVVNVGSSPQEVYKSANDADINTIKNAYWFNNYTTKKHNELSYNSPAAQTDSEKAAAKSGRIAGSSIFIAADAINVNGILQSGYGKYTAVITEEQLSAAKTAAKNQDFSKSKLFEGRRIYMVNEGGTDWEAERATDGSLVYNVQIFYDPDNDTLLAEDIDAQGGKVYLAGRIISTTGGKIFAVDGGADISIDNQTNASMQLGKVLNNNINGEVTLTTVSLDNNGKEVVTTKKYTTEGITTSTGFNPGELNTAVADRKYTFKPEANSRYNWTVGSESTTNTHYYYRDTSILHLDFATFESETGKAKKTVTVNDAKPLPNGIFVSTGTGPDYKIVADNVVLKNQRLNYNVTSKNKVLWKNYYYNWDVKTGSSQTYVSSIKADKPIDIKFIGQNNGTINLKSGGDITLNGNIRNNNVEGTIDITSNKGALKANNGVSILGNKISLNAQKDIANINIETLDKETAVQLGAITSDGNIGINVTGNTEISTIEAKGTGDPMAGNNNVKLEVSGNIEQIAGEGIIGQRIDITSQSGGIGNLDQALKVHAGQQALNNDPLSASVNATAQKDIFLAQNTSGNNKDNDMRIGVIRSVGGNVTLTNEHGSFEDALPYTGEEASDETSARIQRWIDSGLIAGPDRNNAYIRKLEKNVSDYEHDVKESFADYEQMKALHDDLVAKYPDNYNEKWVENYSEEYRLAYESLRREYEHYTDSDDYLDHLAADTNSDYAKLKAAAENPTYKWTQDELLYALRSEMINKEVGSTDSRDKIANISGKNVTLSGKNIGSNETPQSITFDQLKNGYSAGGKTNVDYLKILANSDASDVIRLKDENGKDYFRVTGTAPVGINATGTVTATATAEDISMSGRKATDDGAASVLKIGEVQADKGFVRILGKEGIENALTDQAYTNVIAGKDILLEGGEGAIGSENKPITVQAIGETTGDLSARSNKNIYIKNYGSNPLSVGSIYTPDSVTLYAGNGLVGSKTSIDGVVPYINAQNLYLNGINGDSRSDLGTAERPLYVLGNSVNIQATGNSAHLKGVKYDSDNIVLGAIDMKEDFVLNTAGTITVSNKAAAKKITLSGDKGIVMSEAENEDTAESYINGAEEVNLKASEGDIGSKDNALRLLNNGGKISVAGANGYLIGLERSNLNTVDNMTLGAVGTEDSAGITGDLWVKSQGNLTTNEVINVGGALTLLANKNIDTKGILTSVGDVKVKASDIKLEKNVDTSGNINVEGKNITTEGTLTSNKAVNLTATENVQANGLTADTDVAINAIAVTLSGEVGANNNIGITATGDITTTKAITAGNNITATGDKITSSTWTATNGNITEDAVNITANGKLEAGQAVTLNANEAVTTNETLEAGTDVAITATGDIDTAKAITAGNNITLTGKDINSSGNWTASNGNITVEGKNIANNDGLLSATKAVNLTATENVEVKDVSAGTDVAVKATTITLTGDVGASNNVGITATGDVNTKAITAGNNLTVKGADINASGNWTATSGNITAEGKNITTNGQLSADKAVTLTGTEKVNAKESLTSGADVTVKAVTVELEKAVDAGGNIKATGKDITTSDKLSADKAITLDATGTVTTNKTVLASTDVAITATGDITAAEAITAGNNITLTGTEINASGNWTASDGNITAKGKNITNNDGLLSATKAVNLTATENVEVKDLTAGTDAAINGAAVKLSGEVGANNNVDISATGDITAKNITVGNDLTVKGADITTSGDWKTNSGNIKAEGTNIKNEAGQLIASKAVTLTATEAVNTKGSVAAGTDVTIKATTIELENTVDAGGNINANGKNITTEGQLAAGKSVTLTATNNVDAQGGAVAGTDVAI